MRHFLLSLFLTCAILAAPACGGAAEGGSDAEPQGTSTSTGPDLQRGDVPYDPQGTRGQSDDPPPDDPPPDDPPPDDPPTDDPPTDDPPPDDPPPDDPPPDDPPPDEPTCLEIGDSGDGVIIGCYADSDCCEGFCTYNGQSYIPGSCAAQLAVGEHCLQDGWCLSGACVDGACQEGECSGVDTGCWSSSDCCDTLFCAEGNGYVPGSCKEQLPDGAQCWWHDWCQSGVCTDGICTSDSCSGNGDSCYEGDECCTGLCTYDLQNPYVPGSCFSPQEEGGACLDDSWCLSGSCVDGTCGSLGCFPEGSECWSDNGCCEGFCTYTGASGYTPGMCQPLQPLGSFCLADSWCTSGSCVDGTCKTAGCQVIDEDCHAGTDCCSGLCTYSGAAGEQFGSCLSPQPEGAPCVADMWCESTSCVDGVCQDLSEVVLTFEEVYETVFHANGCAGGYCHNNPFAGLYLGELEEAYFRLVDTVSPQQQCDATTYVVPGDPSTSLLWHKVRPYEDGAPWCGEKMPLGTLGLGAADAALVEAWILQGALP